MIPAFVFIRLQHEQFRGCCPYEIHRQNCAMLASILVACIGILGAGYCFIISALTLAHEPYCYSTDKARCHHLPADKEGIQFDHLDSCHCQQPKYITDWKTGFSSVLLVLSGIELALCALQIINGCIGGAWAVCQGGDKERCPC
ncbi:transmembrane 4 L6 family member 1 [Anolis carolinensis]|uniref:transmembrane 4 L6 family member 1 n=1 Tax=Anolis carolinensis TaxID=28377 RepID=UPI0007DB79C7|nr:PREDICTED: transmembrane 4 L6 family member 1 [Anolis carolinensis]|eukprot:XP_016847556.1 PREDICTED: transmembrane 4 L6 family member 1 [Anolis carolinensis]